MSDKHDTWIGLDEVKRLVQIKGKDPKKSAIYSWLARYHIPRQGKKGAYRYGAAAIAAALAKPVKPAKPNVATWVRPEVVARFLGITHMHDFATRHTDQLRRTRGIGLAGKKIWLYRREDLTPALKALVNGGKKLPPRKKPWTTGKRVTVREVAPKSKKNGGTVGAKQHASIVLGARQLFEIYRLGNLRQETLLAELEYLVTTKKEGT